MALSASDLPAMYSLLTNSLSGEQSVRKPAEAALAQSENWPGFCSCLMVILSLFFTFDFLILGFLNDKLRKGDVFNIVGSDYC